MFRSALVALLVAVPGAAMAGEWTDFYVKLYGGSTAEDSQFAGVQEWDLESGHFLGAAVGLSTPIPGLALEFDLTRSRAFYVGEQNVLEATLAMANVVYSLPVNETFNVYGGAGFGYAFVLDDCITSDEYDSRGSAAAGQVFVGAGVTVVEALTFFGELRYQTALGRVDATDDHGTYGVDYARTAVLLGIKINL